MLLLTLRETYGLNRLSSFKNLRRKGGKFDHRPGRPTVLLRHSLGYHMVKPWAWIGTGSWLADRRQTDGRTDRITKANRPTC